MASTTVFKSNRSQAVRLPKELAFPEDVKRVNIVKIGNARVITPADSSWDEWFQGESVSEDFMPDRSQPENQSREEF